MGVQLVIYGVDFSGAKVAGNKIWIAKGVPDGRILLMQKCLRARDLQNSGEELEVCLPALVNLVKSDPNAAFGFDFPFGLPRSLIHEDAWEQFVLEFPTRFHDPEHFRARCFNDAGNRERRRLSVTAGRCFSVDLFDIDERLCAREAVMSSLG